MQVSTGYILRPGLIFCTLALLSLLTDRTSAYGMDKLGDWGTHQNPFVDFTKDGLLDLASVASARVAFYPHRPDRTCIDIGSPGRMEDLPGQHRRLHVLLRTGSLVAAITGLAFWGQRVYRLGEHGALVALTTGVKPHRFGGEAYCVRPAGFFYNLLANLTTDFKRAYRTSGGIGSFLRLPHVSEASIWPDILRLQTRRPSNIAAPRVHPEESKKMRQQIGLHCDFSTTGAR